MRAPYTQNEIIDHDTGEVVSEHPALMKLDTARYLLAQARGVDEVKDIRDKAEALRVYYRQQRASLEAQNHCAEIKLRAERRAGELLSEMPDAPSGWTAQKSSGNTMLPEDAPTLADIGIMKMQSSRWQSIAGIPDELFDRYIEETKTAEEELTTSGALRIAKRAHADAKRRKHAEMKATRLVEFLALPVENHWQLICSDIMALDIGPDAVDVIITDPPYPREFLPVYGALAECAAYTLRPGGSLLVMIGQSYLPEILALMTPHIRYHWTVAYLTPGGQSAQLWQRNVNTFWKPVLWFVKGEYDGPWIGDVTRSNTNDNDKHHHHWGQSESGMADLIERFSLPNDTILDPFCGGGTTGVVALAKGRRFIGADNDAQAIATTQNRILEEVFQCNSEQSNGKRPVGATLG